MRLTIETTNDKTCTWIVLYNPYVIVCDDTNSKIACMLLNKSLKVEKIYLKKNDFKDLFEFSLVGHLLHICTVWHSNECAYAVWDHLRIRTLCHTIDMGMSAIRTRYHPSCSTFSHYSNLTNSFCYHFDGSQISHICFLAYWLNNLPVFVCNKLIENNFKSFK